MADSHPFATAGLNQFGADRNFAFGGDGSNGIGSKLLGMFIDQTGLKDYLNANNPKANPVGVNPNQYSIAPELPISNQGMNVMRLPVAPPGGTGLNARPAGIPPNLNYLNGGTNPFVTQQQIDPNAKHVGEIVQAWNP